MRRRDRLTVRLGMVAIGLVPLALLAAIPAEGSPPAVRRPVGVSEQGTIWQAAGGVAQSGSKSGSTPASVTVRTVDTEDKVQALIDGEGAAQRHVEPVVIRTAKVIGESWGITDHEVTGVAKRSCSGCTLSATRSRT